MKKGTKGKGTEGKGGSKGEEKEGRGRKAEKDRRDAHQEPAKNIGLDCEENGKVPTDPQGRKEGSRVGEEEP